MTPAASRGQPSAGCSQISSAAQPNTGGNISGKRTLKAAGWTLAGIFIAAWIALLLALAAIVPMPSDAAQESQVQGDQPAVHLTCHTVTAKTYNRQVRKLDRLERLNPRDLKNRKHKRATKKVCKHRQYKRIKDRIKKICTPRHVVTGRVSVFNDGRTATGLSASRHEGLAVNLRPGTDAGYLDKRLVDWRTRGAIFKVKLLGRERLTRIIDAGPAGWVNRALDFSAPLARAMGFMPGFPTDSTGHLYRYLYGCR